MSKVGKTAGAKAGREAGKKAGVTAAAAAALEMGRCLLDSQSSAAYYF